MGVFDTASKKIHNLLGMTTLGQKAKAAALGVTLASDEDIVKAEDGVHGSGDKGVMALGVRKDTAAGLAADGDYVPMITDANGLQWVNVGALLGITAKGQAAKADSLPVTLASDEDALPVTDNSGSLTVDDGGSALTVDSAQLPAALGQDDAAGSVSVVMASDKMVTTGERLYKIEIAGTTINVNTTPYSAGDCQGDKVQILAGWTALNSATLKSIIVLDSSAQAAAFDIIFFDEEPDTGDAWVNNGAIGIDGNDMVKVLGIVEIAASDYVTIPSLSVGDKAIATIKPDLPLMPASGGTLHMVCVARGTPTYANDALAINLVVQFNNDAGTPEPA